MEHKTRTKALSWLLSLALMLSLVPVMGTTVRAEAGWTGGTYTVAADETVNGGITVSENATLTINSGKTLTVTGNGAKTSPNEGAITIGGGKTLTVTGGGTLVVNGGTGENAIGISGSGGPGTLSIVNATVTVTGGNQGTVSGGAGSGIGGNGGTSIIHIQDGTLNATGGNGLDTSSGFYSGAPGISYCNITLDGGTVDARGGNGGNNLNESDGFPGDGNRGIAFCQTITVTKGTLLATSGANGTGYSAAPLTVFAGIGNVTSITAERKEESDNGSDWTTVSGDTFTKRYVRVSKPHTHNFITYALSADGKTITATCDAAGCTLDDGTPQHNQTATLTIAAPAESDAGCAATITDADGIQGTAKVKYEAKTADGWSAPSETEPNQNGVYKASITLGEGSNAKTASVTYGVNAITKGSGTGDGCDFSVPRVATYGAKVTPTLTLADGYEVKKITVKNGSTDVSTAVGADKAGFTMPDYNVTVDIEFGKIDYTITKNSMTFGSVMVKKGDNEVTTAQIGDTITLNATPDTDFELTSLTVKYGENSDAALSGNGNTRSFIMPASNVTVSAVFEGAPFGITISSEITGGTVTAPADTAKAGSEVTLTVTPDAGYDLGSVTVTTESGGAVPVTDNKFTMPTENVTVTAAFVGHTTTATLKVTGSGTAELRDDNFAAVTGGSVVKKAGEKFVLSVSSDDEYDYTIGFTPDRVVSTYVEEFGKDDYEDYVAYAQTNHIPLSFQTDLFWVTMPGADDNKLDVNVTFQQVKSFTILYRPTDNANAVWCKFTKPTAGIDEKPFAVEMKQDAVMGDQVVWSAKVTAAFAPNQIAFAATSDSLANASMTGGFTVKQSIQSESDWTSFGSNGGKFVVISGDVKTVVAAFVTNPSSMAVYDSETVTFDAPKSSTGIVHVITVCATDADGKVTSAGTLTALAAPTGDAVPIGKEFAGWRGAYFGTLDSKVTDRVYDANAPISVRENTTFHAVWNPKILTVKMNLNGGTGVDNTASVEYDHALTLSSNPTKSGYDFGGWTVNKAVTEGGVYFGSGSAFDTSTPITADLELTAQWKHIHSYTYYKISDFGDALKDYHSYESKLHIRACGCDDFGFEAHSFDSSGKCACGYRKLTETATLKISYGKWDGTTYDLKMAEKDRTVVKGQKVSVYAPGSLGPDMKFSKWQYSADGSTWKDLTSYRMMGFPIPADMQLRALYTNPVTVPQISLSATTYPWPEKVDGHELNTILLQMDYQLPDGYYYVDSGVKASDNIGIAYYEMKEVKKTAGQKAALAGAKLGIGFLTGGGIGDFLVDMTMDAMSDPEYYYDKRENSVLDIMTAETLSDYIYNGKPVNMEKFDPLYWDYRPDTKGQSGSLNALIPLNAVQKNNWNHYIYGIAWLRYKDKAGIIRTIYTPALATTIDGVGSSSPVKQTGK